MAPRMEIPITNAVARNVTVVATAAAERPGDPPRAEANAIRTVSRRLLADVSRDDAAAVFGLGESDAPMTTLSISSSTLRTYLKALDTVAAGTATPHHRQACRAVFQHLTANVDAEALGLRVANYDTLEPATDRRVFG